MTVLKDQSGDPITDSAGTEIKANTTVVDALFGDGITRGTVPLDHGKGVNVLIDWFGPRDPSKPKSRGAEHLTVKFLPAGRRHTGADFDHRCGRSFHPSPVRKVQLPRRMGRSVQGARQARGR